MEISLPFSSKSFEQNKMQSSKYHEQVRFVQSCLEDLNKVNFTNVNEELEQKRQELIQGFSGLTILMNAPTLFTSTFKILKRKHNEFLSMMQDLILQRQPGRSNQFSME